MDRPDLSRFITATNTAMEMLEADLLRGTPSARRRTHIVACLNRFKLAVEAAWALSHERDYHQDHSNAESEPPPTLTPSQEAWKHFAEVIGLGTQEQQR